VRVRAICAPIRSARVSVRSGRRTLARSSCFTARLQWRTIRIRVKRVPRR
jgi:hypothetical protein